METHDEYSQPAPVSGQTVCRGIHVLLALMAVATIFGFLRNQATEGLLESTGMVRGWDFQQFYLAGMMPPNDLYDVMKFQAKQRSLFPVDERNIPFLPLYPPMLAMYVSPLSSFSYHSALAIWWVLSLLSFSIATWLMWRAVEIKWRSTVLLIAIGFFPFFVALRLGQLAPILLLMLVVGLKYRSGLALSLLAVKPQYAVGLFLYFLIRREWSLCVRFGVGVLLQVVIVLGVMGHEVLVDYFKFTTIYIYHADLFLFPPGWVHALAGMTGKSIHLIVVAFVATLCAMKQNMDWQRESALAVSFMLLFTPHLLLYDLVLLLVPIVYLLPTWKLPTAAVIASSALAILPCAILGISFIPVVLIAILVGEQLRQHPVNLEWIQAYFERNVVGRRALSRTIQNS